MMAAALDSRARSRGNHGGALASSCCRTKRRAPAALHHLLRPDVPLGQPLRARRTEITLDAAVLDTYVGRYQVQDDGVVVITRDGALLSIELPADWGIPELHLHAESQRRFFLKELPLQATFEVDEQRRVTGIQIAPPRGGVVAAVRLN